MTLKPTVATSDSVRSTKTVNTEPALFCNRRHKIHKRCGRLLLEAHDHAEGDDFYSQDFLSNAGGPAKLSLNVQAP